MAFALAMCESLSSNKNNKACHICDPFPKTLQLIRLNDTKTWQTNVANIYFVPAINKALKGYAEEIRSLPTVAGTSGMV
jgi:hypothetical protein